MDYSKKWNIFFSSVIVFGFYTAFELGLDTSEFSFSDESPIGLYRLNFFYVMLGCLVISYLYLDLTSKQQIRLQSANDKLVDNEKQLIHAKEEAEKSAEAKMHFLSVMSHEIRTPLNTVIGLSALMKERDLAPEVKENIELINFASNNLFSIVNDILDWSKIEAGKAELEKIDFNLKDTIAKLSASTELLCAKKKIQFKSSVDDALPEWVVGDPTRITQILNNLLNNAVKFTSSGDVLLEVKLRASDNDQVRIYFSVSDSGIGMSPDQVVKIFNQFEQADRTVARKYGGSGLGLSIAQKMVALMGGKITVESENGRGSRFAFELDFMVGSEGTEESTTCSDKLKGKHVLVVDDNQLNLVVAQNFLQQWGANYHGVLSGIDALKSLEQNTYDLVLMDISMPEMDGYETTKEIRRRGYRNLPIIALTASAMIRDREKIFSSGMNDCESKPFKPASLYEKLIRQL
ncbi:MAG: response regulator [Leptolyngbya sp. SIO3F4]|nr:response regulator [Leptolyngbya sp. SIO3F4]